MGKPGSLPKVLQHLDRKCGIGSGLGNFAFPTSLRAREAPRKRCHRSRSSGEPASGPLSWTSSPRREAASCFFRLSFAGIGEGNHCKTEINTEINTEQGRCCFSVSVSGDRASPDDLGDACEEIPSTLAGRASQSHWKTPFLSARKHSSSETWGLWKQKC